MPKYSDKYAVGLTPDNVRNKFITVLRSDFKRGKSAKRYAEMVAYVQRKGGKATAGDVMRQTSYEIGDIRWDVRHGHIMLTEAAESVPGSANELTHRADELLTSQVELQEALLLEGELSQKVVQVRSRSGTVREFCIWHHGSRCVVCKLDFGERFGEEFGGLIEVHHKNPLAQRDGREKTNPASDCVPLCPNCHRMAHFGVPVGECRSLDELLELYEHQ
jgi:predicted HNH restriction endonuclease